MLDDFRRINIHEKKYTDIKTIINDKGIFLKDINIAIKYITLLKNNEQMHLQGTKITNNLSDFLKEISAKYNAYNYKKLSDNIIAFKSIVKKIQDTVYLKIQSNIIKKMPELTNSSLQRPQSAPIMMHNA